MGASRRANALYRERRFERRAQVPCFYCGRRLRKLEATVDHKVPLSQGGSSYHTNLCIACPDCNRDKADTSAEAFASTAPWEGAAKKLRAG